jgi:hypothetical protein
MSECRCGRPTRDEAYVCDTCAASLVRVLNEAPWLADELETSITRQRSAPITGSAPSATKGLPWHEKASEAERTLHGLLVSWVRFCTEEHVRGAPTWLAVDTVPSLARWLLPCVPGLTLLDIGPDAVDEITDAAAGCERVVFWKRRSRLYLGTCGRPVIDDEGVVSIEACPGEVYAEEGSPVGLCDDCGEGVTVVIRQAELNQRLDDRLCTAGELARLAVILGLDVPRDTVRKKVHYWHRHKRIEERGTDFEGSPMFRYGEVRSMLYLEFRRDTA